MTLNGNTDESNGYNTVIKNGETSNANLIKSVIPPIGTVMSWLKNFTNTPTLPDGWEECNGQTLSDSDSPFNGQVIPNLNGAGGSDTRFLLGSDTSGSTGGAAANLVTHNHQWFHGNNDNGQSIFDGRINSTETQYTWAANGASTTYGSGGSSDASKLIGDMYTKNDDVTPPYYTVVWIMRTK